MGCRHIGHTITRARAIADVSVRIDISHQCEGTESLSNVLVTARGVNGAMVLPVSHMGPHHGIVVLVIFARVVGV